MTLNRSEILFIYDAQDCSEQQPIGDNRPDAILTPDRNHYRCPSQAVSPRPAARRRVRYYVKKLDGDARPRTTLALDVLEDIDDVGDIEGSKTSVNDSLRPPLTFGTSAQR